MEFCDCLGESIHPGVLANNNVKFSVIPTTSEIWDIILNPLKALDPK